MRLTRPNPCRRPRWMLSPGVLQVLAEVVAAGFREGPDCLGQPRTERTTDGSLAAIELAAHDRTRLVSGPHTGILDALCNGAPRSSGATTSLIESANVLVHREALAWSRPSGSA